MITVAILINGQPIMARSATNTHKGEIADDTVCTYKVDDGSVIAHRHGDGAVPLAIAMLRTIKEA